MKSDIMKLVTAFESSKKTIRNMNQNQFYGPKQDPMFTTRTMSLCLISVVHNAVRIKR